MILIMSLSNLQQLMIDYRFRPNHRFSQNFIINDSLVEQMIKEADLKKTDVVVEIGSGAGSLTEKLLEKAKVVGVELDLSLISVLEERFGKTKNFTLVKGDFVKVDLPKFNKIVALPPYNISSDIMLRLFKEDFDSALLVFQKEFVEKLVAEPGFCEYSYISVLTDFFFETEVVISSVSPSSFYPKPETYSALIKLTRRKNICGIKDVEKFILFVKNVFRYKNKDFSNGLKNCLKSMKGVFPKKNYSELIEKEGLTNVKTNLLTTKEFVDFFKKISQE